MSDKGDFLRDSIARAASTFKAERHWHAYGRCWGCNSLFGFNPDFVPSITVEDIRRPLCRDCVNRANELRTQNGTPQIVILPGAYG